MRDLIEAGMSEPAGWRNGLWGLCRRRLVWEADPGDPTAGHRCVAAIGGGGCKRRVHVAGVGMRAVRSVTDLPGTIAITIGRSSPAGAWGARRGIRSEGVAVLAGHDVSFQKEDLDGGARHGLGRVVRMIAVLPQPGQWSCRCVGEASSASSAAGSSAGTASSLRQSASLSVR